VAGSTTAPVPLPGRIASLRADRDPVVNDFGPTQYWRGSGPSMWLQ
jgi:hypothetical protein